MLVDESGDAGYNLSSPLSWARHFPGVALFALQIHRGKGCAIQYRSDAHPNRALIPTKSDEHYCSADIAITAAACRRHT